MRGRAPAARPLVERQAQRNHHHVLPLLDVALGLDRQLAPEPDSPLRAVGRQDAARVGAELGADIVKVVYTGTAESFAEVVQGCTVPVVIAGGAKMGSDEDIFRMVEGALSAGAAGLSIGRNAFQHPNPDKIIEVLCRMVHKGFSVEQAIETMKK